MKKKKTLEDYAEEIRNLPYLEDRVGQAFIMFGKIPQPHKEKKPEKPQDNKNS